MHFCSYATSSSLQQIIVILLSLEMVPLLVHTKTQLRELRFCLDVTQGLFQLGIR